MIGGALDAVTKRYGRHAAVVDVTLKVNPGEIVGLVGPNGAGKTTALRILARLIRPDRGRVTVGASAGAAVVRYFAGEHTLPAAVRVHRWTRLWGRAPVAAAAARRPMGVLSRGSRQRVGLEATLRHPHPTLLLLDEPWEGLDPDASRWLSDEIAKRRSAGSAVMVSSHRIHDLADICDRCIFLVAGHVAAEAVTSADLAGAPDRSALLYAAFDRAKVAV